MNFDGVNIILLLMALISAYLSVPFFLTPYFSASGSMQRYQQNLTYHDLKKGDYFITIRASTSMNTISDEHDLHLIYQIGSDKINGACPKGFEQTKYFSQSTSPSGLQNTQNLSKPCTQAFQRELSFLSFSPLNNENDQNYNGPRERSQLMKLISFSISETEEGKDSLPVSITMSVSDFDSDYKKCKTDSDCIDYLQYRLDNEEKNPTIKTPAILYLNGSESCFNPDVESYLSGWTTTGCSVDLILSKTKECFPDSTTDADTFDPLHISQLIGGKCSFDLIYTIYRHVPLTFRVIWTWGNILFVTSFSAYMFAGLYFARTLHKSYLKNYYFNSITLNLKKGETYYFKIIITGQQFTKRNGKFFLSCGEDVVYSYGIPARFREEDSMGTGLRTIVVRIKYKSKQDINDVEYRIDWDIDEGEPPEVQIVIRRSIPMFLKTRANTILLPFFFLSHFITRFPKKKKHLKYKHYLYLVLYFCIVYCSLIIVTIYFIEAYILDPQNHETNIYWATEDNKTARPILSMLLYQISIFVPTVLRFLKITKRIMNTKAVVITAPFEEQEYSNVLSSNIKFEKKDENAILMSSTSFIKRVQPQMGNDYLRLEDSYIPETNIDQDVPDSIKKSTLKGTYGNPGWSQSSTSGNNTSEISTSETESEEINKNKQQPITIFEEFVEDEEKKKIVDLKDHKLKSFQFSIRKVGDKQNPFGSVPIKKNVFDPLRTNSLQNSPLNTKNNEKKSDSSDTSDSTNDDEK
ncbi:hypothetical protein M0812_04940 [Anaeramoeba flamelloides]|uniref:Uncharacterized protein n=1 Tax=Anaeramoeba flamelloides TaxID=1746091 RepID=A0AAV8AH89_9EUKA|nr:hypothetical protein M0812_04940 [Anaeramoeba flamelloides]